MNARVANIEGPGVIIPSPGPGKAIAIVGISTNAPGELRENDADGDLIAYIPKGSTNLTACINAGMGNGTGNAVYCIATNPNAKTTATYIEIPQEERPETCPLLFSDEFEKLRWSCNPRREDCCAVEESKITLLGKFFFTPLEVLAWLQKQWGFWHDPGLNGHFRWIRGPCDDLFPGDGFPCNKLPFKGDVGHEKGQGTLCYKIFCFTHNVRGEAGFMEDHWGYTLCKNIPCSSSSSSASSESSSSSSETPCCPPPCEKGEEVGPFDNISAAELAAIAANLSECGWINPFTGKIADCETQDCYCLVEKYHAPADAMKWFYFVCGMGESGSSSSSGQSSSSSSGQSSSSSSGQSSSSSSSSSSGAGPTPSGY